VSIVLRVREYRSAEEAARDLTSFQLPRLPLPVLLYGTVIMAEGSVNELRALAYQSRDLDAKAYAGRHSGRDALLLVMPHLDPLAGPVPEIDPLTRCLNDHFLDRETVVPTPRGPLRIDRPLVMGILNVTPDSFSDGGRYLNEDAAFARAERMVDEGADIIDVGGESTRPGSSPVGVEEELSRVVPVVKRIAASLDVPVSVDTMKPEVARAAMGAGAAIINDVAGLRDPAMIAAVRDTGAAAVVMHMRGRPATMQVEVTESSYGDVVADVMWYLQGRIEAAEAAGVPRERLIVDPGLGFGKTLEHNVELLRRCRELRGLSLPVLVGASRKGFIGRLTGADAPDRLGGSVGAAVIAAANGARVVRVHDVRETAQALRLLSKVGYST